MHEPPRDLTNSDLLALRLNEALALGLRQKQPREIPDWVWNVAKKLWVDFMPAKSQLLDEETRESFVCGLMMAFLPCGRLDAVPHEAVLRDAMVRSQLDGGEKEVAQLVAKLRQGVPLEEMFSREELGRVMSDFVRLPSIQRLAFANGLLLGTSILHEFQNGMLSSGGSPRRTVLLVLWLNWQQLDAIPSVAAVYGLLNGQFERSGQSGLLGDWERFKKIAQEVRFKVSRRRKGKSEG